MSEKDIPCLWEELKQYFNVGVAVPQYMIENNMAEIEIVKKHFNQVVAENCTKMQYVYPEEDKFYWDEADSFIKFAKDNNKIVRWHTFVWHSQSPVWIFFDDYNPGEMPKFDPAKFDPEKFKKEKFDPSKFDFAKYDPVQAALTHKLASKEQMEKRVQKYIQAVTDRYKGIISSYDVVNEVISDKRFNLRTRDDRSLWQEIMGPDYVEKAFFWARECDPNAELVINDYNLETIVEKRDGMYDAVKKMLSKGVPITTVGLQMHISMVSNPVKQIEEAIEKFASLGVNVIVTEMDVSIHAHDDNDKEPKILTAELLQKQADYYYDLFECFKRQAKKGNLTDVVWWGVTDKFTWKNNFPVFGRGDAPLLFDTEGKIKPSFWSVCGKATN